MYTQAGWLFTMLFYVIWNFVLVGIVTGQIVTAFQAIREKESMLMKNEAENCLVCSIDRFTLEQNGESFDDHTSFDHSPWAYACFMVRLGHMQDSTQTGCLS